MLQRLLQVGRRHARVLREPRRDAHVLGHQRELEARGKGLGKDLLGDFAFGGAVLPGRGIDHVYQRLRVEPERLADQQGLEAGDGSGGAKVVVERLGGVARAQLAAMEDLAAHLLQHRPHAGDVGLIAADHDRQRAVAGLRHGARHRRVHHGDALRREHARQLARRRGIRGAHVHHHRAALEAGQGRGDRVSDGLAVRHHGNQHVGAGCGVTRGGAVALVRLVPGLDLESGASEIRRHELAHAAQADEADHHQAPRSLNTSLAQRKLTTAAGTPQ